MGCDRRVPGHMHVDISGASWGESEHDDLLLQALKYSTCCTKTPRRQANIGTIAEPRRDTCVYASGQLNLGMPRKRTCRRTTYEILIKDRRLSVRSPKYGIRIYLRASHAILPIVPKDSTDRVEITAESTERGAQDLMFL